MNLLIKILISSMAIFLASLITPGVYIENYFYALLVAVFMLIINYSIKPILIVLTIPITIFTLGLFLLVINVLMIYVTDYFIDGFHVKGFFSALFFSLIVSLLTSILENINKPQKED